MRTFIWHFLYGDEHYHSFDFARSFIFELWPYGIKQELRAYVLVCSIQLIQLRLSVKVKTRL